MKTIYLIRHSGPFVELKYKDKIIFEEQSKNMILSVEGEEKAKKLSKLDELQNIDAIYCANSARAIETAKYIASNNNLIVNIENNFNERSFGINYIEELPEYFIVNQFKDENYKLPNGESLNDVKQRIKIEFANILNNKDDRIVIVLHGIALMTIFKLYCDVEYDEKTFKIIKNGEIIYNDMIKAPDVFKVNIDNNKLVNIQHFEI